jgi:hypothetical protein
MLTQAVRCTTGDGTSFTAASVELVVSGAMHDHTTSVHVLKCVPLQSVTMFGKCETTRCGELPHISKIDRHFLYCKKRMLGLNPLARDNDEKDGRPLKGTRYININRYITFLLHKKVHSGNA